MLRFFQRNMRVAPYFSGIVNQKRWSSGYRWVDVVSIREKRFNDVREDDDTKTVKDSIADAFSAQNVNKKLERLEWLKEKIIPLRYRKERRTRRVFNLSGFSRDFIWNFGEAFEHPIDKTRIDNPSSDMEEAQIERVAQLTGYRYDHLLKELDMTKSPIDLPKCIRELDGQVLIDRNPMRVAALCRWIITSVDPKFKPAYDTLFFLRGGMPYGYLRNLVCLKERPEKNEQRRPRGYYFYRDGFSEKVYVMVVHRDNPNEKLCLSDLVSECNKKELLDTIVWPEKIGAPIVSGYVHYLMSTRHRPDPKGKKRGFYLYRDDNDEIRGLVVHNESFVEDVDLSYHINIREHDVRMEQQEQGEEGKEGWKELEELEELKKTLSELPWPTDVTVPVVLDTRIERFIILICSNMLTVSDKLIELIALHCKCADITFSIDETIMQFITSNYEPYTCANLIDDITFASDCNNFDFHLTKDRYLEITVEDFFERFERNQVKEFFKIHNGSFYTFAIESGRVVKEVLKKHNEYSYSYHSNAIGTDMMKYLRQGDWFDRVPLLPKPKVLPVPLSMCRFFGREMVSPYVCEKEMTELQLVKKSM